MEQQFTNVKFISLDPEINNPPKYAHPGDAGFDIQSLESLDIAPHETQLFETGLALEFPPTYILTIHGRTSLSKKGIIVSGGCGCWDSSFRGFGKIALTNTTKSVFRVERGDKIAQGVLTPVYTARFINVDHLSPTERGEGKEGSTGK